MNIKDWFEAMQATVKAGGPEVEVTLRCLAPGKLYEAQWGRKRVCAADIESALDGLLVACGGSLP